jgi:hypothetical protein
LRLAIVAAVGGNRVGRLGALDLIVVLLVLALLVYVARLDWPRMQPGPPPVPATAP